MKQTSMTALALSAGLLTASIGAAWAQGTGGNTTPTGEITAPALTSGTGLGPNTGANGKGVNNGSGLNGAQGSVAPSTGCMNGAKSSGNTAASGNTGATGMAGGAPNTVPDSTSNGTSSSC